MIPQSFDIGSALQSGATTIANYIPKIIGFLVIVVIGYLIAKIVKSVANKVVDKLKVDEKLKSGNAGQMIGKASPGGKPSHLIGAVAFWIIFIYALSAAIGALAIPALTGFMNQVLAYLPNVLAAMAIVTTASSSMRQRLRTPPPQRYWLNG